MTEQNIIAVKEIREAEKAIEDAINNAKIVASRHNRSFSIYPTYGLGADWYSPGYIAKDLEERLKVGSDKYALINLYEDALDFVEGGWVSSSMEC